jgi:ubiquinone/menaquinone biosynthesis C-methylase UbiE
VTTPPVCSYEDSDYQTSFWDKGRRAYEDGAEAVALRRLLPKGGHLMLELGAGAGRNTLRYTGFEQIILVDYSRTQLEQAQARLGRSKRYVYVAADIYRLPFVSDTFDAATMIRALHHMADAPKALQQVRNVLQPDASFILEFASKQNLKAIFRYWLGRQMWNPFTPEPVEFAELNFDFHPKAVRGWLNDSGFKIEKMLTVSHFRVESIKRIVPASILIFFDSLFQWTGALWQLTPSVFVRARVAGTGPGFRSEQQSKSGEACPDTTDYFKCPECSNSPLDDKDEYLSCSVCGKKWGVKDGIYDFREPAN